MDAAPAVAVAVVAEWGTVMPTRWLGKTRNSGEGLKSLNSGPEERPLKADFLWCYKKRVPDSGTLFYCTGSISIR